MTHIRRRLNRSIAGATRFARCQLRDTDRRYKVHRSVDGVWQGEDVVFDIRLRPLFMDYSIALYEAAAEEAYQRFPGFADCTFEDGPNLGERRVVFESGKHDLALAFMFSQFWILGEDGDVTVSESFVARPDHSGIPTGGRRTIVLDIALDRPSCDESTWQEIAETVSRGLPFPVDPTPRRCDLKLAREMWTEMSLPELAYMNWDVVRKPLTKPDEALFEAVKMFDSSAIAAALREGADPNAIDEHGDTPLICLVETDRWWYVKPQAGENYEKLQQRIPPATDEERLACIKVLLAAGAHIDLAGPDGIPPLVGAVLAHNVALVEYLLERGADDTINPFDDTYPGDWPAAWDYAATDLSLASRSMSRHSEDWEKCEQVWRALRRLRQAPNGTLPGERPDW